jgi:hypothetical protein
MCDCRSLIVLSEEIMNRPLTDFKKSFLSAMGLIRRNYERDSAIMFIPKGGFKENIQGAISLLLTGDLVKRHICS